MKRLLILFAALTFAVGCSKNDDSPSPEPTDRQTLLMYFPWSGNLTSFFRVNIEDMKQVVAAGIPNNSRVVVFFMENATSGRLFELRLRKGIVEERALTTYALPDYTTVEGIAAILENVKRFAPATRYAMSIGSHGMAWLPAHPAAATASLKEAYGVQPAKEYWEYTDANGLPLTRWFGGTTQATRADAATLASAIERAGIKMEYILFDVCYMSSVEVAYDLRNATDHLIASPHEIINYGFPYANCGQYMLGRPNYTAIVDAFHAFYMDPENDKIAFNCGTIAVTHSAELEPLAALMKQINNGSIDESRCHQVQVADNYSPHRFYDLGDYVEQCCTDSALRTAFAAQMERTIPATHRRYTPTTYYSNGDSECPISTFSGVMCSDPSTSSHCAEKEQTAWWKATH